MKKLYETPSVEKIAFRYRDQVVVASGEAGSGGAGQGGNSSSAGEQFIGRILEGIGVSTCKGYECSSLADLWA